MSGKKKSSPGRLRGPAPWLALSFLLLALLMVGGIRIRLLDVPLERDEGEYAYAGQLILNGIPPYQAAVNMKLPGTYVAYALILAFCGQTPSGIHMGLLVVHLLTLGTLFLIARKMFDLYAAVIATAAYALMILSPAYKGLAAHATHFVVLPMLLGLWTLIRRQEYLSRLDGLVSGMFLGVAFAMKQPAIFFIVFGGCYLAGAGIAAREGWRKMAIRLGLYLLGSLLPFIGICLWLKIAGVFPQFWFWTVTYALEYVNLVPLRAGIENAKSAVAAILSGAPLLWVIAGLGMVCLGFARLTTRTRLFLAGFLVFSALTVCPGLYFREHYFITVAPAVAMLAGCAVSCSGQRCAEKKTAPWVCHLPFWVAAVACAQSLYTDRAVFFSYTPREACRSMYGMNPFPESLDIARYIQQNARADQSIAVIGSEPQIYFYAHRRASTRYIYLYPLMELHRYALKMQEDMIREIEGNPPDYLVLVSIPDSWLGKPESSSRLQDWTVSYVSQHMRLTGLIQFVNPVSPEAVWGPDAVTTRRRSLYYVAIYQDNRLPTTKGP